MRRYRRSAEKTECCDGEGVEKGSVWCKSQNPPKTLLTSAEHRLASAFEGQRSGRLFSANRGGARRERKVEVCIFPSVYACFRVLKLAIGANEVL